MTKRFHRDDDGIVLSNDTRDVRLPTPWGLYFSILIVAMAAFGVGAMIREAKGIATTREVAVATATAESERAEPWTPTPSPIPTLDLAGMVNAAANNAAALAVFDAMQRIETRVPQLMATHVPDTAARYAESAVFRAIATHFPTATRAPMPVYEGCSRANVGRTCSPGTETPAPTETPPACSSGETSYEYGGLVCRNDGLPIPPTTAPLEIPNNAVASGEVKVE